eukprot:3732968-Pyramimonas_sp.AAC.1
MPSIGIGICSRLVILGHLGREASKREDGGEGQPCPSRARVPLPRWPSALPTSCHRAWVVGVRPLEVPGR